jgi:hypothetical protein
MSLLSRCVSKEEQEYLRMECPLYTDIREKFDDLDGDDYHVMFFQEVLDRRDKLNDEDVRCQFWPGTNDTPANCLLLIIHTLEIYIWR